jgi:hypothetical protein
MAHLDTVEYLVTVLLNAGVSREQVIRVSRDCESLFDVDSKNEAEMLAREYIIKYEKKRQD